MHRPKHMSSHRPKHMSSQPRPAYAQLARPTTLSPSGSTLIPNP